MAGKKAAKPAPIAGGDTLWVMSYSTHTSLGSVSHVSPGDKLYRSKEACQAAIDEMPGWIGMGDRSKYRPLRLEVA